MEGPAESADAYLRAEEYSYHMPHVPRFQVRPLPMKFEHGNVEKGYNVEFGHLVFPPDPSQDISFLNDVKYDAPVEASASRGWQYHMRRSAQAVLSFIYIGPSNVLKDQTFLLETNISLVLHIQHDNKIGRALAASAARSLESLGIASEHIFVNNFEALFGMIPQITELFNRHLVDKHQQHVRDGTLPTGTILVTCESGNDTAAGVIAAYLMEIFSNIDDTKAIQVVQTTRFCCSWDDSLKNVIRNYWGYLQARRDVQAALSIPHRVPTPQPPKRMRTVDDDEAETLDDYDDTARFRGRTHTPFHQVG